MKNFKFTMLNLQSRTGGFTPTPIPALLKEQRSRCKNRCGGFTLFVSIVLTGVLLLIATGLVNLSVKQSRLASAGEESQHAFYAADTGVECALFWDVQNPSGATAFATSTGSVIHCNKDANNSNNEWVVGGNDESTFTITFLPDPFCARVVVYKPDTGRTTIESFGYNTCDENSPRRLERAVRAEY